MSDTPETDANRHWKQLPMLATSDYVVHVDFARKLERERDALRNLLTIALQHGLTDQVRAEAESLLKS